MILIADSGSTKTDWVILEDPTQSFSTLGFNPFYRSEAFISSEIRKNEALFSLKNEVKKIFFYGAGCSSDNRKQTVKNALSGIFLNAEVHVEHDLLACAHALYAGRPVIASILGTGTNTCYFDGKKLLQNKPSLGYVLGDEASGAFLGKKLITKVLYKELESDLLDAFQTEYDVTKDQLLEKIYMEEGANTYLASFAPFYFKYREHQQINQILTDSIRQFFETHILCYDNYKETDISFIGSIAYTFQKELRQVAEGYDFKVNTVLQKPMDGLIGYHLKFKG